VPGGSPWYSMETLGGQPHRAGGRIRSMQNRTKIRRRFRFWRTRLRELRMIAKGLLWTQHPLLVHIIPIRRCNLSCTYCNEYDDHSKPVPLEEMYRRLDRLAGMGAAIITISGGEPLLHPELDLIDRKSVVEGKSV
jgi:sulfatase maturation enzyme AslB (radical SAM superfamily)